VLTPSQGSFVVSLLRTARPSEVSRVETLSRRPPKATTPSANTFSPFVNPDLEQWGPYIASLNPTPSIFFSSLSTTRGDAGSFQAQYTLEREFNGQLARTAKEAGVKTYVLISAANANSQSMFGYVRMKGEIEEDILALDFEHTVIVRPGMISGGPREKARPAESVLRAVANTAGKVSTAWLKDFWAQDAEVIGKAAVNVALKMHKGEIGEKVAYLNAPEIIKYGRTEWKDLD
jgi:hypothetical protein